MGKKRNKYRFVNVPRDKWPYDDDARRSSVWLSDEFLVQEFTEDNAVRLSVNRVRRKDGGWEEDITWDELQTVKRSLGYGDQFAVEIYPADLDIVNLANMRHLWVPDEPIDIGWRRER